MGPTTAGKTQLAVRLVERLPCDVISVDSAMVYRDMDIGTAKPTPEVLARVPHRLIDICDPAEPYSAARFRQDALREIDAITAKGRIPLLVGGTGLYFRALQNGISKLPSACPPLRDSLSGEARRRGWPSLHAQLAQLDPASAKRIHPNDPQRILRALEVFALTGRGLTEHFSQQRAMALPYRVVKIVLAPSEREVIHHAIRERFHRMLERGFVEEVRRLYIRGDLDPSLPSMRIVGYRQVWRYLDGALEYPAMVERAIVATRQLAKRQLTWLRSERNATWFDVTDHDVLPRLLKFLEGAPTYVARW
ncbi:MAG: tRNA (adenosine(37)-N6)-dimethylallyltransferase MiaA [Gammaproteobacteria bacterium]|nr:tRNA (adenosine(37)-N6)-dimethylallyltransferase MiaA [Gammaproteobacteria bacterium]